MKIIPKTFPWKEFLRTHPIFGTLRDNKQIDALLDDDASWEQSYAKDDVIVRQGDVGNSVFLIGAGTAEATLDLSEGPPISLSVMRKGDLFGEMALLDHQERSATVKAKQPCTMLEFDGRAFEQLMDEYPEIASRLLLTISRRLRNTGEQILGMQLTNVDEKLKYFNHKLDTEQKLVETQIRAAQQMFDNTKLRTDEVISSAERSRDRLNKLVGLVSALGAVILLILGAFGYKQVWDLDKIATASKADAETSKANAETSKANAEASTKHMALIEEQRKALSNALTDVNELKTAANDVKGPFIELVRQLFVDSVKQGKMDDAQRYYGKLISLGGPGEFGTAVDRLETKLLSDDPGKPNASILALFEDLARDSGNQTDKSTPLKVYRLHIGYLILTDQDRPDRERLDAKLTGYLKSHPTVRLQPSLTWSSLLVRVQRQDSEKAAELKALGDLTTKQ